MGKTTLLEQVADALPAYDWVDEPYFLLEDDGYEFADPPSAEDYEVQLRRSIAEIAASESDALFDRCPADFLAYLLAIGHDVDRWLERARTSMARLDLVVFVPIEEPDRIIVSSDDDLELRRTVDDELEHLLFDDALAPDVLVVQGDTAARVEQVLGRIRT